MFCAHRVYVAGSSSTPVDPLRIILIQPQIAWEKPQQNITMLDQAIPNLPAADVYLLPEMWSTGFSMNTALAEPHAQGPAFQAMQKWAQTTQALWIGSLMVQKEKFFNRCYVVSPDGSYGYYDKRYLFTPAQENLYYERGSNLLKVLYKGWKIVPQVCYDLRFGESCRNVSAQGPWYDVLIYVANWPSMRHLQWQALLTARAVENQAYVAGVNCTGTDRTDKLYSGGSSVWDPQGHILAYLPAGPKLSYAYVELSYAALQSWRKAFPAWQDALFHIPAHALSYSQAPLPPPPIT
ncbi:MAG: nitrilase-related carbon-nitrogen hydrolase [Bacteroidia bacterium]